MTHTFESGAQWVSDQLARYARLVDRLDSDGIGQLLAGAEVVFKGRALPPGSGDVSRFYRRAFATSNTVTLHLPFAPVIDIVQDALRYEAPYMRLRDPVVAPQIEATGMYRGVIHTDGSTWRFRTFQVDTH